MSYISRTANRFYAAPETVYGVPGANSAANRLIASGLRVQQISPASRRRDKTGSRTYAPASVGGLKTTAYQISSYLTSSAVSGSTPCAVLFAAGCGVPGVRSSGLLVANAPSASSIETPAAHGLSVGSGVSYGGEVRFVTAVGSVTAMQLNAPFSTSIAPGAALGTTTSFGLGTQLSGVTLYDYWDPQGAISRMVLGAAVDRISIDITGDQHEMTFAGRAAELLDSQTFTSGSAGLQVFPVEPVPADLSYSIVPGQLGQAWMGSTPQEFFTITDAQIRLENNALLRQKDVGAGQAGAIVPGARRVFADFTVFAQNNEQTNSLYEIAERRGIISVMLQLGQQSGRMMAIYLPGVTPQVPVFDDSTERLLWRCTNNQARGFNNDELYIAFA